MDVRRVGSVTVFVILLCVFTGGSSESRKRTANFFFDDGVGRASPEIDEEIAEKMWINCRLVLMHMRESVEDFDLYLPEETTSGSKEINSKSRSLATGNIQKAISDLPPQIKETLLDCLRKQNLRFRVSGEESGTKNWYTKYLESLFSWSDAPRRYLRSELHQYIAAAPASAPAVDSPTYSPAPSSDPAPASSQAPNPQPPAESPGHPISPPDFIDPSPQPSSGAHSSAIPDSATHLPSKKHNSSRKSVIIAVVATTAGTFAFSAILFLCYRKSCRNHVGSGDGQKDEKPLLSLSGLSLGSSQKSFSLGNPIHKEKFSSHSSSANPSHNRRVASLNRDLSKGSDIHKFSFADVPSSKAVAAAARSSEESSDGSNNIHAPLPPPPGRASPPPPVPLPPPIPSGIKPGPHPPPPPKGVLPPPRPPQPMSIGSKTTQPSPLGPNHPGNTAASGGLGSKGETEAPKAKLKPFFWDKVLANPDHSMVWHQLSSGSFQFNEEMIENLFGYTPADKNRTERKKESSSQDPYTQYIQIIDSKKSQNLSILLRAVNLTTEEVCDALQEGNELPIDFLQTVLKMGPTAEEELKLRLFSGELSQLGPAERFLKVLVDIPFAFKRLESLLFMSSLQEEVSGIKESFATLEVACKELRNSRLFLKLLEAVLKTGNRMNDGTFRGGAQAFKMDTLLKLADVKGTDGKTTLLHFVVQEIIRSEGVRAARAARESQSISSMKSEDFVEDSHHESEEHYCNLGLQVVSGLGGELENVRKAAVFDADGLTGTVSKLGHALLKTRDFLNSEMKSIEEDSGFHNTLKSFVEHAEVDITWLLEEEKRIMALVKSTADYFHGNAGKDEGLRLFVIIRDFLIMLDKSCKDVRESPKRLTSTPRKEAQTVPPSPNSHQPPSPDLRQRLFPAIMDRRMDNSSSDDESLSP
ncbi:hypothetical protein HHK36_023766 [Tetracentron sinense]|uniref:Formin-like protein n=1 Tax=Tetracentron sinense TaxID=13715 RepID=A0A834YTT1_TETSI|nr:hypothetical protein HHK36_023766 [Tetracentron sinense]